jgi:amino acid transporter
VTARGAAFLGIGAMVGAGIFALLGEAGAVAGSAVWLSFLLAGIVAALLGYTVVKLGVRFPSSGGLIAYLTEGFGNGRLVGVASWLGYFAAIVTPSPTRPGRCSCSASSRRCPTPTTWR